MPESARRSPGSPRMRSPRMLRITSDVPPSMVLARLRRNFCWMGPCQSRSPVGAALRVAAVQKSFWPKEIHAPLIDVLIQLGADQLADRTLRARTADGGGGARAFRREALRLRAQPQLREPVPQHRRVTLGARRPQRGGIGDGARAAPTAATTERGAFVHQRRHRHVPAVAHLTEAVLVRDARVGEVDLVELGLPCHLAQRPGLDACAVHVDHEVGQSLVLGHIGIGARQQQAPARPVGQARPHLLTVDHPVVAVGHRGGGQPGQIGPGARLGEQLAPEVLGGRQRPQPLLLDVLALRVLANGRRGHAVAHRVEPERHRTARALQDVVGDGLQAAGYSEPARGPRGSAPTTGRRHNRRRDTQGWAPSSGRGRRPLPAPARRPVRHQRHCSYQSR